MLSNQESQQDEEQKAMPPLMETESVEDHKIEVSPPYDDSRQPTSTEGFDTLNPSNAIPSENDIDPESPAVQEI